MMYFRKYGLWKTWLDERLKSRVSEDSLKSNMENGAKSFEIWMNPPLPYVVIPVKAID